MDFLDFEKPIVELERRIEELKLTNTDANTSIELDDEIHRLQKKCASLTKKIFSSLSDASCLLPVLCVYSSIDQEGLS